jgi:hypothetical protein
MRRGVADALDAVDGGDVTHQQGQVGDLTVIASGLRPGERVVSGATFLVDSESRLRAAIGQAR